MKTRFLLVRIYSVYRVLGLNPVKQTMSHMRSLAKDWMQSRFGKHAPQEAEGRKDQNDQANDKSKSKTNKNE